MIVLRHQGHFRYWPTLTLTAMVTVCFHERSSSCWNKCLETIFHQVSFMKMYTLFRFQWLPEQDEIPILDILPYIT